MNIRTKFLAVMLSLFLITGMATILIGRTVSTSIIEEQVGNHLETTAQSRAHHIETVLGGYRESAGLMATGNAYRGAVDESKNHTEMLDSVNRRMDSVLQSHKDISRIRVLDKNGIVIASTHVDVGSDKSASEMFLKGREEVYIKDIHTSEFTENEVMSIAAPILVDDKVSGVLIVNFDADEIFGITTDKTGLGETGEIFVVNSDGYIITPLRFTNDTFLKQDIDPEHFYDTENHEQEAVLYEDYRGVDVLGAHTPIPAMNWCLRAEIDESEAFASVTRLTIIMFSTLLGLLFLGTLVCIRESKTIADPIVRLHHGTEEIMKGNLDYKVGTKTEDEVGELSRMFDKMTANLKESGEELEGYSRGLEKKVEERTARLNELLKESEQQKAEIVNIANDLKDVNVELNAEINERKQAEEAMRLSEEQFSKAFHGGPLLMTISVIDDGTYVEVNENFVRISGYSREDSIGTTSVGLGLISEEDRDNLRQALLSKGKVDGMELTLHKKSGETFCCLYFGELITVAGKQRLLSIAEDITERKQAEKARERLLAELEENNEDLVRMVKAFTGREVRMSELKKQIAKLEKDAELDKK